MITVEKGRPIPPLTTKKYPWSDMEVGDSFWVPMGENEEKTKNMVRCAATAFGRRRNMKFSVRKNDGGFRVWRIE